MEDYKIKNHDGEYIGTSRDEIIDGLARFRLDEEQYNLFPDELWKDGDVIIISVRAGNLASHMFDFIDAVFERLGSPINKNKPRFWVFLLNLTNPSLS